MVKIGGIDVMTLSEAASRYGVARKTLLTQIRRERLEATRSGNAYLVTSDEMERYVNERKGQHGFASPAHPFHGRRPPRKGEVSGDDPLFFSSSDLISKSTTDAPEPSRKREEDVEDE